MSQSKPLTPQLAKLIVLEWQLANCTKMKANVIENPEEFFMSPEELVMMTKACDSQIELLKSNITYQRKVAL